MVQVLKQAVRERIDAAALRCFARSGYPGTSITTIAAAAGTAPGNVYRYYASKRALLEAVVPPDLASRHDALLDSRIAALTADPRRTVRSAPSAKACAASTAARGRRSSGRSRSKIANTGRAHTTA